MRARRFKSTCGRVYWVDAVDADLAKSHPWKLTGARYLYTGRNTCLHRLIAARKYGYLPKGRKGRLGRVVSFKDDDRFNLRRENVHIVTRLKRAENMPPRRGMTSPFRGVSSRRGKKWMAQIFHKNKHYNLGTFSTQVEAARAYDAAAKRMRGPNARVNFPRFK